MKIYISGKITGDKNYRAKFQQAEDDLRAYGHEVMNPAILPPGFSWTEYMSVALAMQNVCDGTLFLPDWKDSKGAIVEHQDARYRYYSIDEIPR